MSANRKILAVLASACAMAVALGTVPSAADAVSRNFKVRLKSAKLDAPATPFQLVGAEAVPCPPNDGTCRYLNPDGFYPMEFEGRPPDGKYLRPSEVHEFELKYYFTVGNPGGINYAADLVYARVNGLGTGFRVRIMTSNFNNDSECVSFDDDLSCTARGDVIAISDPLTRLEPPRPPRPAGRPDTKGKEADKPKDRSPAR